MNYYRYRPDANNYAGIGLANNEYDRMAEIYFSDMSLAKRWTPTRFREFDDNPPQEGDFPSLSDFYRLPVMSERAWDALYKLFGGYCEPLPIVHPSGKPFYIAHVMETSDCLDESRSELRRSRIDNQVNRVFRYCFHKDVIKNKHLFKLPWMSGGELIFDDVFREAVERNYLRGLTFTPLETVE